MINRNNITPKNSSQMVLSGRNNILHPGLKEGIIAGDGNVIGDGENITIIGSSGNIIGSGCENVVLINSFDCEITSGLSNVSLNNSSGVIVTESNVAYEGSAIIIPSPSSGDISSIYFLRVDIDQTIVTSLDTNPVELLAAKPGYIIDVINAKLRQNYDPNDFSGFADLLLRNGTATVATFVQPFPAPLLAARYHIAELETGDGGYAVIRESQNLSLLASTTVGGGPGTITLFITYQYIAI